MNLCIVEHLMRDKKKKEKKQRPAHKRQKTGVKTLNKNKSTPLRK